MSIINILGFEDQKYDWGKYGDSTANAPTNYIKWFDNNIKYYVNNSGYNHQYLQSTRYYASRSSTITTLPPSSLYDVYDKNYKLLNKELYKRGVSPSVIDGTPIYDVDYTDDIIALSFNLNLSSGTHSHFRMFFGGISGNETFRVNTLNNQYTLYTKGQRPAYSGYLSNGSNSIGLLYKFSTGKYELKVSGITQYRGMHDFELTDINSNSKDIEIEIHPSINVVRSGSTTVTDYVYSADSIKFSDCIITNNELFHNHKVICLNPIATKSGNSVYGGPTFPYYGGALNYNQMLTEIKTKQFDSTGSGLRLIAFSNQPFANFNIFTPTSETSGKYIHALKAYYRVKSLGYDSSAYNHYVTGFIEQSGKLAFDYTYNYGNYVYAIGDLPSSYPQSNTYNKVYTYNPYTGTNWSENDLKNISIGASGQIRLTDVGAFVLLGESTPTSGDYFDNVKLFCKTRELQNSGQFNLYLKTQDCVTTLRPSGDAYIEHPNQWSDTTLWSKVNEDPDFIGDDSDYTQFNQSGNFRTPSYLYYIGDGLRRIHLTSGTHNTVYNESSVVYNGRLYWNENRNDFLFGTTSLLNYASLDDTETGFTNQEESSLIDWKTNIGYRYLSTGQIIYTLFNSNGTTVTANTSISTGGSPIVYHDIDHKNRQVYYLLQDGRLFRQDMNTFAVSGIGTLGISVKTDNFNLGAYNYQWAAFDFDKKQIFFLPHDGTRSLGIGTTTFSGTIPTYTLVRQKSVSPLNESYYDSYNALIYNKYNNELIFSKINSFTADSGYYKAGIYKTFPSISSGNTTLIEVNQVNNTLSSGTAYGLALDAPRYKSTVEFNLSDIPNDVLRTTLQQFSNVSVKLNAKEKATQAYVTPKIYSSGGNLLWRTDRQSVGFIPSGNMVTRDIGLFNSTLYIANNRPEDWQDAKLRLDIHYPSEVPHSSGELEIYAVEVKAACSGVFQSAPQKTGIFPLYTHGILRERDSIDLHTLAGTTVSQIDLYTAGHLPVSSGVDLFIKYQIAKSGVDLYINGITKYSGSMNLTLLGREVKQYTNNLNFVNFGATKSGVFNTFNITTHSPTSGDIKTSINFNIGATGTESNNGTINFMIYSPVKTNNKSLNFVITNNWSGINRSIPMMIKTRSGTPGAIPFSGSMNMFIARSQESAASHIPFYVNGPASNSGLVNFITVGTTHSSGTINFHTYAEKDDSTGTQNFYTHGY